MELLKVLACAGPATASEVARYLKAPYSSALQGLNKLVREGMAWRDESLRPFRYDLTAYGAFRAYREGVLSLREAVFFFEREGDLMPALAKRAWNALGAIEFFLSEAPVREFLEAERSLRDGNYALAAELIASFPSRFSLKVLAFMASLLSEGRKVEIKAEEGRAEVKAGSVSVSLPSGLKAP